MKPQTIFQLLNLLEQKIDADYIHPYMPEARDHADKIADPKVISGEDLYDLYLMRIESSI